MGVSTSPAQLAAKFEKLGKDLTDPKVPLNAAGLAGKRIFEASAASAGALGIKPSGKRKAIGARYDFVKGEGAGAIIVTYTGPAHLINNPIARHFIAPKGFGSASARSRLGQGIGALSAFGGSGRGVFAAAGAGRSFQQRGGRLVSRKRRGGMALTIGDDFRGYAFHPGTKGKSFFQRAKELSVKRLPSVYAKSGLTEPLRKAFA